MKLDELQALHEMARPTPWLTPEEAGSPYDSRVPLDHEGCDVWPWYGSDGDPTNSDASSEASMKLAYKLRNAAPAILRLWRAVKALLKAEDDDRPIKSEQEAHDRVVAVVTAHVELRAALRELEEA